MKLDVVTKTDGNIVIRSTWIDNPKGAVKAYHHFLDILSGDESFNVGWVAILNDELSVFENYRERISNRLPSYTVTFNSHGGSFVEAQTVVENSSAIEPEAPTRDGYEFAGWELDGYPYSFSSSVIKNIVLVAAWEKAEAQPEDPTPSEPQPEE